MSQMNGGSEYILKLSLSLSVLRLRSRLLLFLCFCFLCYGSLQLLQLGLPVARQPSLEAACQGLEHKLLGLQPPTAAEAWPPQHSLPHTMGKRPLADAHATSSIHPAHHRKAAGRRQYRGSQEHRAARDPGTGTIRGLLQSQSRQQEGGSKNAERKPGQSFVPGVPQQQRQFNHVRLVGGSLNSAVTSVDAAQAACAQWDAADLWAQTTEGVWLQACHHQRDMLQQEGPAQQQDGQATSHAADTAASSLLRALPQCEAVEWSVAKYALYEAAEAVVRRSGGKVLWDPNPQLPVLQLARSLVGTRTGGGDAGEQDHSPCSYMDGEASPVDEMQLAVIPAGRAWVQQHLEGLPAVRAYKD